MRATASPETPVALPSSIRLRCDREIPIALLPHRALAPALADARVLPVQVSTASRPSVDPIGLRNICCGLDNIRLQSRWFL
jgi:hypothetical protein